MVVFKVKKKKKISLFFSSRSVLWALRHQVGMVRISGQIFQFLGRISGLMLNIRLNI